MYTAAASADCGYRLSAGILAHDGRPAGGDDHRLPGPARAWGLLMADYFDLGGYARPVTTSSAQAQTWFTRGLLWAYAFNHEEAVTCFEHAIEADPGCALAHWGVAYALGPNYNKPWEAFDPADLASCLVRAQTAVAAAGRAPGAAPVERALAGALAARYPSAEPAADLPAWSAGYAGAMREVYRSYPD